MSDPSRVADRTAPRLARGLAIALLAFGVIATLLGVLGAAEALVDARYVRGCATLTNQLFGVGALLLAALGVLHLIAPLRFLRAGSRGSKSMVALCVFNSLMNLAIAVALIADGVPLQSTLWWLLLALNAAGIALFRRTAGALGQKRV